MIRESSKKLYPRYSIILKAKQQWYPDTNAYPATETCVEIKIQPHWIAQLSTSFLKTCRQHKNQKSWSYWN